MIFCITSEALIFANMIAAYLYLEIRNMGGPFAFKLPSEDYLDVVFPLINTFILLASSIPARFAGSSIAKGNRRNMMLGLLGTIVLGCIFLAGQAYEYTNLIASNFTVHYQTLRSAFYTLTGFQGFHVT